MQFLLYALPLLLLAGCDGCRHAAAPPGAAAPGGPAAAGQHREELLTPAIDLAIDNLNRLEEFSSADVLQQILERLDPRNQPKPGQTDQHFDPLLAAWPEPEMLGQIVDRLNQWVHAQQPPADWRPDPMAAGLPKPLADLPQLKDLGTMEFSPFDGYFLQEAAWLRDVGLGVRGDVLDDLERAKNVFDWTVRNIQLEADRPGRTPQFPWETLLFGRGTAAERAWVFILLLRQLDIDAAMLAVGETFRPWCVGVLIEGEVYLFDPSLGLPIPAPNGVTRGANGQLTIQPAALAQVVAEPKLLRRLDAGPSHKYGVEASEPAHVAALLEASPDYLSRRMKLLESRLAGDRKMVLTTAPAAHAGRWKAAKHVADARLWRLPFETLERRWRLAWPAVQARLRALLPFYVIPAAPLYRGRVLYLRGKFVGEDGATSYLQAARPSNEQLQASSADPVEKVLRFQGKQDASYWLGLTAQERGKYDAAVDYFTNRTRPPLIYADGPWTSGARYNLARTYEASGDIQRAILLYRNNASSPGYHGDLLRAKWLSKEGYR